MKKINKSLSLVILLLPLLTLGQNVSLDSLVLKTRINWPIQKQQILSEQLSQLRIKNNNASWMPNVSINSQATYQSDVTSIPIHLPNINLPEIKKDAYKITLDVQQTIFDGGLSSAQNDFENADLAIQQENINNELKKAELMTAEFFFNVLIQKKNREQILLMQAELNQQIELMKSRVKNGTAQQSSLDLLKVEAISLQQKLSDLNGLITSNTEMLSLLSGMPITSSTEFIIPEFTILDEKQKIETLEIKLFDLNMQKLSASENFVKARNLPVVAAFAQAGYGRPGLNMFMTDFDTYYIAGIKASWAIWRGGNAHRDRKIIEIQKEIILSQKDAYMEKMEVSRIGLTEKINNINTMLTNDYEILQLRESILKSYASQLENGVITATEYLDQLNLKTIAAINFENHKIQLLKEQYNFLRTFGQ